ncbi:uncharacterized protein CC84DRAFT_1160522 [Paraphaeosphaeria sporulosa]|uniref:Secreted protein n=1 Tax=Paraphaeosphaeria sporulosa TaxID=1460663 RepID=A0A177CQ53_9PLEO|nr:uncharacterized protein CC84DRAFT_1160522 [Paraphaeosphaeria sporulosa]OAG09351.1 hypothetical protein CC84DRAFT_1160522 [Paraphaeosphaeria sporulosa]
MGRYVDSFPLFCLVLFLARITCAAVTMRWDVGGADVRTGCATRPKRQRALQQRAGYLAAGLPREAVCGAAPASERGAGVLVSSAGVLIDKATPRQRLSYPVLSFPIPLGRAPTRRKKIPTRLTWSSVSWAPFALRSRTHH